MTKKVTSITLIDDHQIVRAGLKGLLEKLSDFKVIQEFESGVEFVNSLPLEFPSDIFILDYSMPDLNGIEVLQILEKNYPDYKVLLLTQHFDEQIITDAYHFGARGFLHKNCTAIELQFAIESIIKTGFTNIYEILKRIKNYEATKKISELEINLTTMELKFLELVCDSRELTYDQMAQIMNLSVKSVEVYRARLFDRFKIKSKVGLVLFSFNNRLTIPFL